MFGKFFYDSLISEKLKNEQSAVIRNWYGSFARDVVNSFDSERERLVGGADGVWHVGINFRHELVDLFSFRH